MIVLAAIAVGALLLFIYQDEMKQETAYSKTAASQAKKKEKEIRKKVKKLGQDIDKDGLTKAEEDKLGTSDFSTDSDKDGVPDRYDIVPTKKGRNVVKFIQWNYKTPWKWEVPIPIDVLGYYEKVKRPRWAGNYSYFSKFIDANDTGIQQLAAGLKQAIQNQKKSPKPWAYYEEIMFVVKMVQNIQYTDDKLTGFDDYAKYPMQTISDGTGDCEDLAILAAALLHKMEFDVKLVHLDREDSQIAHLGIAVWGENVKGTSWEKEGKQYYYIETTDNEFEFGEMPEEWLAENVIVSLIDIN